MGTSWYTWSKPLALVVTQKTSACIPEASANHRLVSACNVQEVIWAEGSDAGTSCSTSCAACSTSNLPDTCRFITSTSTEYSSGAAIWDSQVVKYISFVSRTVTIANF